MKLTLLKNVGNVGVITGYKNLIPDRVRLDVGESGTLYIGAKSYSVDGFVEIAEYDVKPGPNKVTFVDADGQAYACGTINRNGRFISITNNLDTLVVDIALCYDVQNEKIKKLEEALSKVTTQYGISII